MMWIICKIAPDIIKGINIKEFPCDRLVFKKKRPENCYYIKYDEKTGELFFPTSEEYSDNSIDWAPTFFENPYKELLLIHPSGFDTFGNYFNKFERMKLEEALSHDKCTLVGLTYSYKSLKESGKLFITSSDISFSAFF